MTSSSAVGAAWLVAYGWVTSDAIDQPIEEVIPAWAPYSDTPMLPWL